MERNSGEVRSLGDSVPKRKAETDTEVDGRTVVSKSKEKKSLPQDSEQNLSAGGRSLLLIAREARRKGIRLFGVDEELSSAAYMRARAQSQLDLLMMGTGALTSMLSFGLFATAFVWLGPWFGGFGGAFAALVLSFGGLNLSTTMQHKLLTKNSFFEMFAYANTAAWFIGFGIVGPLVPLVVLIVLKEIS